MQADVTSPATDASPAGYVIRYTQSFGSALDAGKLAQARLLRGYYLTFGVGLVVGGLLLVVNQPLGMFTLLFSALMLVVQRLEVMDRLVTRRQVRSVLDQPIQLSLGEEGILWEGPTGTHRVPWASLTAVRSNERTVVFLRDRVLVAYVPADAFRNAAERVEAIAFAQQKISNAGA